MNRVYKESCRTFSMQLTFLSHSLPFDQVAWKRALHVLLFVVIGRFFSIVYKESCRTFSMQLTFLSHSLPFDQVAWRRALHVLLFVVIGRFFSVCIPFSPMSVVACYQCWTS